MRAFGAPLKLFERPPKKNMLEQIDVLLVVEISIY